MEGAVISLKIQKPTSPKLVIPQKAILKVVPPAQKNAPQRMSQSNYSRFKDQRDHVYNIPDTYVGGSVKTDREERILDLETLIFKKATISIPEAVERLFVEIISNAGDNSARSLFQGIDPGEIEVWMSETTIRVRNGGIPIPVEIHEEEQIYVPELIFGTMMSSSSYDKSKKRQFSSRNGFGSKLTNIFSKKFQVTVADPYNGLIYHQEWRDNMKTRCPYQLEPYPKTEKAFVEIEYVLDFERFGYQQYPKEAFELFSRHVIDTAYNLKIPVSFNGKKFKIETGREYAALYLGEEAVKSSILYYAWTPGTETVVKKNVEFAKNKGILPLIEICAVDTPDNAEKVAFVNNMWTRNLGVHYEAAFKAIASGVLDTINNGEKKKKKTKDNRTAKLTMADVKKHVSLFVSCWIEDPIFDSQSKNELKSPAPKVFIDEKILQPIMKWELVSRLYAELDAKQFRAITKSDGKKKRHLSGMEKLQDANKAATVEAGNCTLYITEGDSASTFAIKLCSYIPNGKGRDYIGIYPLKGKPLNVMNAPATQIAENKEINDLKKVLGLREGIDYRIEENYKTLRYGHLMVLADADNDGKHILGLVLNLFHCKYPTLLVRGYVKYLRTKILEVQKGKEKIKFYTQHEYDEWKAENPDYRSWKHAYFKGLGTSEDKDIEEESCNPKIVMTAYDELAPDSLRLAFDQKLSDERKKWISEWKPDHKVEQMKLQPISSFIHHEFIQFSIADVARSIPRFTDGLKISQRKIVWAAMKKWKKAGGEKIKVAQFAPYVSETTSYAHGENSLVGAIVGMAQDFVGANNLSLLKKKGQFGTRTKLGKDASSARYIFTLPEWSFFHIFRKEDLPILQMVIEEGKETEPVTMLPILPLHLINGCLGIGSGTSTYIPAHNPLDLVYWLEAKIKGYSLPEVIPWYRDFIGEIKLKKRGEKEESDEEEGEEDEEDPDRVLIHKNTKISMVTYGSFEEGSRNKIIVNEIPIGRSIHSYKNFLDKMREEKVITKYDNYSTADNPKFEIYGVKKPNLKKLKLVKSYGMSNMVLLDNDNRPVKYENAEAILETFYSIRLGHYGKRKDYIIKEIGRIIEVLEIKIKFILAIIKGYSLIKENSKITDEEANEKGGILVVGRNKRDIGFQMERCGFDAEMLKKVTLYQCTEEEVDKAREEIEKWTNERKKKEETKPEEMWLEDLKEFTKAYCKHYKCEYEGPKPFVKKEEN